MELFLVDLFVGMESNTSLFFDEEDCLPCDVFIAELDLVTSAVPAGTQNKSNISQGDLRCSDSSLGR